MSKFSSKPATVNYSVEDLDAKFADFSGMQNKLEQLPEEQKSRIGDVRFTNDSIVITTPQVGAITLRAEERRSGFVRLQAESSPVPMAINISYKPVGDKASEIVGEMEVDLPVMLRPLVGPALQKAVDQFGTIFASLA